MTSLYFDEGMGKRYEDAYGGWISFFEKIATAKERVTVYGIPTSWAPLCSYLGARVGGFRTFFPCDTWVNPSTFDVAVQQGRAREYVEHVCVLRPELVDALYQDDTKWKSAEKRWLYHSKDFVVTSTSSFQRREVLDFMLKLDAYVPEKRSCVLVPCAADKPYPSPLHEAVREVIPDHYELIIATGVLGLVPEALWPEMPHYDSGIPNEWRLMQAVETYFAKHTYNKVVSYCDFYNEAIWRGCPRIEFVNDVWGKEYLDLRDPVLLEQLSAATRRL